MRGSTTALLKRTHSIHPYIITPMRNILLISFSKQSITKEKSWNPPKFKDNPHSPQCPTICFPLWSPPSSGRNRPTTNLIRSYQPNSKTHFSHSNAPHCSMRIRRRSSWTKSKIICPPSKRSTILKNIHLGKYSSAKSIHLSSCRKFWAISNSWKESQRRI